MKKTLFLVCGLLASLLSLEAGALDFTVDRTDDPDPTTASACDDAALNDCSLRGAIQSANAHAGPDVIVLPASAAPYTLSIPFQLGSPDDGNDGDLDISDDVTIEGNSPTATVINGNGSVTHDRIFHVGPSSAPTVTIRNLTLQNGHAVNGSSLTSANVGGGIFIGDGTVLLESLQILSNSSGNGATPVTPNTAGTIGACGGGVAIGKGTVTLSDSTIAHNAAGKGGNGSSSTAAGGQGGSGGGICINQGTVAIRNTTIFDNFSGSGGDAFGSAAGGKGGDGGGLFLALTVGSANVTLNNVTMMGNSTGIGGDGAPSGLGGDGGGLAHPTVAGTLTIGNSVIAGNMVGSGGVAVDCGGGATSEGFNLIGINNFCTMAPTASDDTGTLASPLDPLLDSAGLAGNGGPTQTIALQALSPAKDAGDNATCESKDQRGEARPVDGPGICDRGAFEITACGDGAVQSGETCDDGNTESGDGCDAGCQTEAGTTTGTTAGATTGAATAGGTTTATGGTSGNTGGGCSLIR